MSDIALIVEEGLGQQSPAIAQEVIQLFQGMMMIQTSRASCVLCRHYFLENLITVLVTQQFLYIIMTKSYQLCSV